MLKGLIELIGSFVNLHDFIVILVGIILFMKKLSLKRFRKFSKQHHETINKIFGISFIGCAAALFITGGMWMFLEHLLCASKERVILIGLLSFLGALNCLWMSPLTIQFKLKD